MTLITWMVSLVQRLRSYVIREVLSEQPGQGLVEYGLLLILIAIGAVGVLTLVGGTVSQVWYDKLLNAIP